MSNQHGLQVPCCRESHSIDMNFLRTKHKPRIHRSRRGAAVVEFAVCVPVVLLIVFGAIESASLLFLRQALVQSAYEGAKVAVKSKSSNAGAIQAATEVAAGRRIDQLQISFQPSDVSQAIPGELVTVTVSAPGDSNSLVPFGLFKNQTVAAQAVMVKE